MKENKIEISTDIDYGRILLRKRGKSIIKIGNMKLGGTAVENSIEETIKQLELILKVRKEQKDIIECAGGSCINCDPDIKALTESINILSDYKRVLEMNEVLLKENEKLKSENSRLKVIRYSTEYGTENIHLITKSDLVQIDINKYMIEIEAGKFVDLKQVYQENEELHKETEKMKSLDIYKLVEDLETGMLISKQKLKDILEKLKNTNFNDYTNQQDGNEIKMKVLYEFEKLLESEE